jgi:hypothetical protein
MFVVVFFFLSVAQRQPSANLSCHTPDEMITDLSILGAVNQ